MAFFTLASPFETHPAPQVRGSVVLFRDKLGNLIVCEPEPANPNTKAQPSTLPSISKEIKTIDTTINTAALQQYTIFEGTDGNKYLSPNTSWPPEPEPPRIHWIEAPHTLINGIADEECDDDEDEDTPPYKLDHMYARKPVKPGEEVRRPVKRRSSKNSIKNEVVIQESAQDEETQIHNIMGRSIPVSTSFTSSIISRPRILNVRETPNSKKTVHAFPNLCVNGNFSGRLEQEGTTAPIHEFSYYQESVAELCTTGNDVGSFTYNNSTHTDYQNGHDYTTDSVEDMNSSTGSGSNESTDVSPVAPESQGDSNTYYISTIPNEEVHEIVV